MKVDLQGKVALVTGAGRGIGRAIADTLAANDARVVYTDRDFGLVEEADEGGYTARALGESIFTEADTREELVDAVRDAVRCHFDKPAERPKMIRFHYLDKENPHVLSLVSRAAEGRDVGRPAGPGLRRDR